MKKVVIMPGGFHPFHAGHFALYNQAVKAFPGADVYVAATDDTSKRPFPFAVKEKLAQLAGVPAGRFVKVKSPFSADEITSKYDLNNTVVIFVRSEKDRAAKPQPGGVKKDGTPAKLQPLTDNPVAASQHTYMAYLPTVEFGPGMTSATQIREAWPTLNEKRKTALVMSLYPRTQTNPALAKNVVGMLDAAISGSTPVNEFAPSPGYGDNSGDDDYIPRDLMHYANIWWNAADPKVQQYIEDQMATGGWSIAQVESEDDAVQLQHRDGTTYFVSADEFDPDLHEDSADYIEERWSQKYKRSINCANPNGFSQRAHCAGRKK